MPAYTHTRIPHTIGHQGIRASQGQSGQRRIQVVEPRQQHWHSSSRAPCAEQSLRQKILHQTGCAPPASAASTKWTPPLQHTHILGRHHPDRAVFWRANCSSKSIHRTQLAPGSRYHDNQLPARAWDSGVQHTSPPRTRIHASPNCCPGRCRCSRRPTRLLFLLDVWREACLPVNDCCGHPPVCIPALPRCPLSESERLRLPST